MRRSMVRHCLGFPLACACTLALASCVSWQPGWVQPPLPPAAPGATGTAQLLQAAQALEAQADTPEKVADLVAAYEKVVAAEPTHYLALWKAGNYHILLGACYTDSRRAKQRHYLAAAQYCERAMYTNPEFRRAVDGGEAVWTACDELSANEVDAMGYWYTAAFYTFKECLTPLGRLMNTRLVIHNDPVMRRIDALDPKWAGGGNYFSRGLYCIAAPPKFGGGMAKAAESFAQAIAAGPNHIVNRWGRARYLYTLTGDRAGYLADLEWVLQQDPRNSGNTYPWNVYFQRQAKEMIAAVDTVFPTQ